MLLIFGMGNCPGQGRVIDQGRRVIVPKGKSYCSRSKGFCLGKGGGVIDPWGRERHLRCHQLCLWPQIDHRYVPIKCMKALAYFVVNIATLHTPKCHEMLVHGKLFLLLCKIPGLINAHLSIC